MKIRTDFVTNSSSSSYAIMISVKPQKGRKLSVRLEPEGNGSVMLYCTPEKLLISKNLESLTKLLLKSLRFDIPTDEYYDDYCDEEDDEEYEHVSEADFLREQAQAFTEKLKAKLNSIDDISEITVSASWSAYGEGASLFWANAKYQAPEMLALSKIICESQGEEKEKAKIALVDYLDDFPGRIENLSGDGYPYGLMDGGGTPSLNWRTLEKDIEVFAQNVVAGRYSSSRDSAEEEVVINFKDKTIKRKSCYDL